MTLWQEKPEEQRIKKNPGKKASQDEQAKND